MKQKPETQPATAADIQKLEAKIDELQNRILEINLVNSESLSSIAGNVRYMATKINRNPHEPDLLTVNEAVKFLRISRASFFNHLPVMESTGAIKPVKIGRKKLFRREELSKISI